MPKRVYKWTLIQSYYDQGHGFAECARRFGFSHTAWIKAIKRGELRVSATPFSDRRRKYDWAEVQAYYDRGHSYEATALHFGFTREAWYAAMKCNRIKARSREMPLCELLVFRNRSRSHLKVRLLKAGLLENRCVICGLAD